MTPAVLIFNAGIVVLLLIVRIIAEHAARNPTQQDDHEKIDA